MMRDVIGNQREKWNLKFIEFLFFFCICSQQRHNDLKLKQPYDERPELQHSKHGV